MLKDSKNIKRWIFLLSLTWLAFIGCPTDLKASEPPKKVLIYWDGSLSMAERSLDLELELLSHYFDSEREVQVQFVPFDHQIRKASTHVVTGGKWEFLRSIIEELDYDGIASFDLLEFEGSEDLILIFSDGVAVLQDLQLPMNKGVFLISSLPDHERAGTISKHVNYLNLHSMGLAKTLGRLGVEQDMALARDPGPVKPGVQQEPRSSLNSGADAAENRGEGEILQIRGRVFDRGNPVAGATLSVKGKEQGVLSAEDGSFEIEIETYEVLLISFLGLENQEVQILGDDYLEIFLDMENNELEEVVLTANREAVNKISTAYGEKNENQVGYTVQNVESEVFEGGANISDATRGKIISYNYSQNDDLSQIQLRQGQTFAFGTVNPLIVIDEIPMGVNQSSTGVVTLSTWHIDPSNVEKITVLRGLAATNKYGTLARNGAILIYTKTGTSKRGKGGAKTNSAMLQGNIYNESVTSLQRSSKEDYLELLERAKTAEEAYDIYLEQRASHFNDFEYFVNTSEYMLKWGDPQLTKRILLNTLELNPNSLEYLRYTGMLLQDRKDFTLAEKIYEKALSIKPEEAQSYRDLALIYAENKKYQEALDVYQNIKNGQYPETRFDGLKKALNSEMKRLLLLHKGNMNTQGLPSHYFTPLNYDVRVVVEWNDRNAEFDLQFVNPQKKFFVWSHTREENTIRLEQEKAHGFNAEEFLLIDAESGKWQINIEAKDQKSRNPLALRYTVYRDYGKPSETRQSKTILLNNVDGKYLLGIIKV